MECKKKISNILNMLAENGVTRLANYEIGSLRKFEYLCDVSASILDRKQVQENSNIGQYHLNLLSKLAYDSPDAKAELYDVVNKLIDIGFAFADSKETDAPYAYKMWQYAKETCTTRPNLFPDKIKNRLQDLTDKIQYKYDTEFCSRLLDFVPRDEITKVTCNKCGWTVQLERKDNHSRYASGEKTISSCPRCNPYLEKKTYYHYMFNGRVYIGKFVDFFLNDGKNTRLPLEHQIIGSEPYPEKAKRDMQKIRLYRAENELLRRVGKKFESPEEARTYLDEVLSQNWFKRLTPKTSIRIKMTKSNSLTSSSCNWNNTIRLSPRHMYEMILLHELAHQVVDSQPEHISLKYAAHGELFAYTYLELVRHQLGDEVRDELAKAFDEGNVKWREGKEDFQKALDFQKIRLEIENLQ